MNNIIPIIGQLITPRTVITSGGGGYSPATDPNVVEWVKADAITGVTDGNNFTTWPHSTGQDATTVGTGPTWNSNVKGTMPAVYFADNTNYLATSTFGTLTQPYTIWIVFYSNGDGTGGFKFIYDGISPSNRAVLYRDGTTNNWSQYAGTDVEWGPADKFVWHIVECQFNGSSTVVKMDGVQVATGNSGTDSLTGLTLGTDNGHAYYGIAYIGEIIVQNTLPSNESGVWTYLNGRWNVY